MCNGSFNNETTCRGCLENIKENSAKSLFETHLICEKEMKLSTVLSYCTNLDFYEDDGLPTNVCTECFNAIQWAFTTKQQFMRANTVLRSKILELDKKRREITVEHLEEGDDENISLNCDEFDSGTNYEPSNGEESDRESDDDDEDLNEKRDILRKKLKLLPGGSDVEKLTDPAIDKYLDECRKPKRRQKAAGEQRGRPRNADDKRTCQICKKTFSTSGSLKVHMVAVHSETNPFLCSTCGEGFKNRNSYKEHLLGHDPSVKFECPQCNHISKNNRLLKYHIQTTHGNRPKKSFLCGVCGKSLTQKQALQKHMMIHTGEKPYKCDLCGKNFRYLSVLKLHKRYHTEERPYPCSECDKRFREKTHLRKHMMIHTGEKPHECDICGKQFNTKTYLNIHRKTHTGERNHNCAICGKGFLQKYGLTMHMNTKHPDVSNLSDLIKTGSQIGSNKPLVLKEGEIETKSD